MQNHGTCISLRNNKFRPVYTVLMPCIWKVTNKEKMYGCVMKAPDMGQTTNGCTRRGIHGIVDNLWIVASAHLLFIDITDIQGLCE
jgi:hypothetical protein